MEMNTVEKMELLNRDGAQRTRRNHPDGKLITKLPS